MLSSCRRLALSALGRRALALSALGRRALAPATPTALNLNIHAPSACQPLHTTAPRSDLIEFFDDPAHWGEQHVRVGRSWLRDELRLKSNSDLHKLWFVLLKERNMLLTMEQAYRQKHRPMPNQERLDKVAESMDHLEEVVRERNRAYFDLEVGTSGEQERHVVTGPFGLDVGRTEKEHVVPLHKNKNFLAILRGKYGKTLGDGDVRSFYRRYREKTYQRMKHIKLCQLRKAANTLKRFPDTEDAALEEAFPLITAREVKRYRKSLGHHQNDQLDV